jgi:hypothetical protein
MFKLKPWGQNKSCPGVNDFHYAYSKNLKIFLSEETGLRPLIFGI